MKDCSMRVKLEGDFIGGKMRNRRVQQKGSVNKFDFDYVQRGFRLFNKLLVDIKFAEAFNAEG